MTIILADQWRLATTASDFLNRVTASCFGQATAVVTAAPAVSGTAQRQQLARNVLHTPDYATELFAWVIVTRPQFNSQDDLTDANINAQIVATWDAVAMQYPLASGP
jgi:hypothetical protein